MPSPLATVQDRLPAVLERAEATLQILGEIVSRIPGSLDRSDRFFTNVERIIQESELPALSADSRKFFTTTSAQIEQITSELEGVIGPDGKLVTFVDEARAAIKAADLRRQTSQRVPPRTRSRWRPTICGARCRPFGTRSISCANWHGNSRSSRSRSSSVPDPR